MTIDEQQRTAYSQVVQLRNELNAITEPLRAGHNPPRPMRQVFGHYVKARLKCWQLGIDPDTGRRR
jgi:hypothetical protein